jgi:putative transcription factor
VIKINCDLCGKIEESPSRALIEGVELDVCQACCRFGKMLVPVKRYSPKEQHMMLKKSAPREESVELIVDNYSEIVKKKRESMGLSQKEFAMKLNEKESIIHKIETGHLEPSLDLAGKLQKVLGIKLVERHQETRMAAGKGKKDAGFTLGDFVKVRK